VNGALTVSACIGCGDALRMAPCDGRCDERYVELAAAEDVRAARAAGERAAALAAVAAAFAGAEPEDHAAAYAAVQQQARAALALPAAEPPEDPLRTDAWWCAHCDRVEAPRECLGICIRRPVDLVDAHQLDEALAAAAAVAPAAPALARTVAHVTPRDGHWQRTWTAFRDAAREIVRQDARHGLHDPA
jgi:hypothetical protein